MESSALNGVRTSAVEGVSELDCSEGIEALIDAASADAVDKARVSLDQFKGRSEAIGPAIDEFLLDLMTLVFVAETTRERFHNPVQRLVRMRLTRIRLLLGRGDEKEQPLCQKAAA
ncbi:hypothetical protein X737_36905 [Mesorhizobium sp. L48C026A00]|nr:hypothetical protein X737_36905 [Mesorhizobium sp. L48C026A00]